MTPEREATVVANAQAGDERAQNELIAEYLPLVYNIVGRALHGHADVDDVVQETMLRALDGMAGLRKPHRFRAWLVAVTMNEIRRHWHSKQASARDSRVDEVVELADPGADFVDLTIIRLGLSGQRREVAEATRWLDEDDRALLSLWWLEAAGELTRSEVAAALKLPSRFVAVRVQRMKAQLEAARLVVRALSATSRCPRLEPVVARWDGVPSTLWRKRISRHVRDCRACSGRRSTLIPAQSLLVGIALVPPTAALAWSAAQAGHGGPLFSPAVQLSGSNTRPPTVARHAAHRPSSRGGRQFGGHRRPRVRPRGAHMLAGGAAVTAAATVISVALGSPDDHHTVNSTAATQPVLVKTAPIASAPPHTPSHPTTHPPTASPSRTPTVAPRTAEPSPTATPTPTASNPPATRPLAESDPAAQVLALINQARAAHGLPPYTITTGLTHSATGHNSAMDNGCGLSHQCPGEAPLGGRETAAGVQWGAAGENIGQASAGPDAQQIATAAVNLTQAMLNEQPPNDGHRQNILSSTFTHVGIAVYRDPNGTVWLTQDFSN
ncbi:sigma-70 family RNA polymerase sigma factor [Streptantibioticus ferralitis]|uniref:RNA polymerase sigma factor n=1 Tax=Streptantibioticus ferralitis TaxID=236510 RepID=A0ABT5Z411_9ACTN|nr:sigma-70 family RNA polymerase sigma factor [Streptantibioticus ferralitis]MDF2258565.1 sigma-70 family RNA polymerase sigma factor [Streptantibioticus ferralitis]